MWFFGLHLEEHIVLILYVVCGLLVFIILLLICCISMMRAVTNHCAEAEQFVLKGSYDLTNKIILITGANSGIGKETTRVLSKTNATIIMACRNLRKAQQIQHKIIEDSGNRNIFLMKLDLSNLKQINEFITEFSCKYNKLHILMANAGVCPYKKDLKTDDGLELAFGVNHIGNMHLILSLRALLSRTYNIDNEYSRIVITGAHAHLQRPMGLCCKTYRYDINELNNHSLWNAYCHSKLCSLMFVAEFVYRYPLESSKIYCLTLHPGVGQTELVTNKDSEGKVVSNPWNICCVKCIRKLLCIDMLLDSVGQLAFTQIFCALKEKQYVANGAYYRGVYDKSDSVDPIISDEAERNQLWNESMSIIQRILGKQDYL